MLQREGLRLPMLFLGLILMLLLGLGTVYDDAISKFLYSDVPSAYGSFFAAFGELPAYFALHTAGIMLVLRRGKRTRFQDIFLLLGGVALILLGVLGEFCEYREDLPNTPFLDAVIVTLILFLANTLVTFFLMRSATREVVLRFVMAVVFVCAVSMVVVNLAKIPWGRPRMRFLAANPGAAFVPWYRPGADFRRMYPGIQADEFRSFPSGHVTTAACSLLWLLFPTLHRFFEGKGRLLLLLSVIWTSLVTLSRLTMGAHFLSDTAISWLFAWLLFLTAVRLFYREGWVFRKVYSLLS